MKSKDGMFIEADVVVNDTKLDLPQAMTLRVAVSSFLMVCNVEDLGPLGAQYAEKCREILKLVHSDIKKQRDSVPSITDTDLNTQVEISRLESCLRYIWAESKKGVGPEDLDDMFSRALRGKSLP